MKRIGESDLLSLACYKASKKMVNQLSKRILVGHKLHDACRYFVGKFYFIIFLATIRFWHTTSKKYATPILVQLIYITKGTTGKPIPDLPVLVSFCALLLAQFLPPK